jgi:hypothetical protein
VAGTALVLILGLAAWWLFWSARLVWPAEDPGAFGITVPSTSDTAQWTFGESVVCLEGVDSAVVESVEPEAGDARVTAFAVRPVPLGTTTAPCCCSATDPAAWRTATSAPATGRSAGAARIRPPPR